jgi:hypothetical protein
MRAGSALKKMSLRLVSPLQQVDTCPGDSVRNAQGVCVTENEPRQEQNPKNQQIILQCNILNLACQSACTKMASFCDRG